MKETAKIAGIVGGGIVAVIFVMIGLFALSTAITAVIIAALWNWCGVHNLFNAEALSFWEVVGVAIAVNFVRNILWTIFYKSSS